MDEEYSKNIRALQKLNAIFADEYSMKVYKTKSGSYVARTLDGKDVLVAK